MTDDVSTGEILRRFDRFETTVLGGFEDIKKDYVRRDVWLEARSADAREVARLAGEAKEVATAAAEKSSGWRNYLLLPIVAAVVSAILTAATLHYIH